MKPAPFTYHKPETLDEALSLLAEGAEDGALILAGGQSLVPMMALRVAYPPALIDINAIPGLDAITVEGARVRIGATVRHAAFHDAGVLPAPMGAMLNAVVQNIAHYPIRQRGTFCGSLAHADPSSEWCLVSAVLGAGIELRSATGARVLATSEYFEGPMMTLREPDEMITGVTLDLAPPGTHWGFYEFNRRAGDFAIGMALVLFEVEDGVIANARLGLGGIEEHPRRIPEAEAALNGLAPTEAAFATAAEAAMAAVEAMGDATTPAEYRRDLAGTVLRRALAAALKTTPETAPETA